ncbi:glycosyltransferase [Puniceicoccaceae bacterium K14]|nr:glycosyltransferase [Puniceicoccaceae bacterium K14]
MKASKIKVLLINQEFFPGLDTWFDLDYIATRKSITPGAEESKILGIRQLFFSFLGLLFGKYNVVILPAFRVDFNFDGSTRQKWIRKLFASGLFNPLLGIVLAKPYVIVVDRDDVSDIQHSLIAQFKAKLYFKANLREQDKEGIVQPLPYWILESQFDEIVKGNQSKDIDLFFAGKFHQGRKRAIEKLIQTLNTQDLNIVVLKERVDLKTYYDYLNRSRLVLSPSGIGWHCFRHYESLVAGAIPVIDKSEEEIVSDLKDGQNAIIYQNSDDAAEKITHYFKNGKNGFWDFDESAAYVKREHLDTSISRLLKVAVEESQNPRSS